jgi:hypothetical protein
MTDPQANGMSPAASLRVIRVIWLALLMGQIGFMFAIVVVWHGSTGFQASPEQGRLIFLITVGMLLVSVPLGYFIRSQTYKRNWQGTQITPQGYFVGNLILLAMCESVSLTGLVATLLSGRLWPTILPSVAAMAVQVVNFPNGRAMRPAYPDFNTPSDR